MTHYTSRYRGCAVCGDTVRAHSRYCEKHSRRAYRTGDPKGRVFADRELRPYRKLYNEYLDRHADHPAVVAAHKCMYDLLHAPYEASFMRSQMDRLRNEGATPREMLVAALSVFAYDRDSEVLLASDACVTANIGRAVLKVRGLPKYVNSKGKLRTKGPTGTRCRQLGQRLRDDLAPFVAAFVPYVDEASMAPLRSQSALRRACEVPFAVSFSAPEVPVQSTSTSSAATVFNFPRSATAAKQSDNLIPSHVGPQWDRGLTVGAPRRKQHG